MMAIPNAPSSQGNATGQAGGFGLGPGGVIDRTAVLTVTWLVTGLAPSGVTEPGETEQLDCAGRPLQLKLTVPLNPPAGVTVSVKLAESPATTVTECGEAERANVLPVPPTRFTVWGLPGALSVIVIPPLRLPAAVGVNVTLMVQLVAVAREAPVQSSVSAKSPMMAMLLIESATSPVLSTVTVSGLLVVPNA